MRVLAWLLLLGLTSPLLVAAWVSFSPDSFLTPPTDVWSARWYERFVQDRRWTGAAVRSLRVAALATIVSLTAGVPLAAALAGRRFRGRGVIGFLALLPLGVPTVALAAGWLPVAARLGGTGAGWGLVLAHGVLGLPLVVLVVGSHLRQLDPLLATAARTLGASAWQAFRRVTLPLALPGVFAAAAACFVLSVNEAVVSVFLSAPRAETLPAVVWPTLRQGPTPLVAVAAVLNGGLALVAALVLPRRLR